MLELDIMIYKESEDDEAEKKRAIAKKLKPVLEKNHQLLVTLLLCNAAALEALPIFLDKLVPSW